jgi:hypothetical protein
VFAPDVHHEQRQAAQRAPHGRDGASI